MSLIRLQNAKHCAVGSLLTALSIQPAVAEEALPAPVLVQPKSPLACVSLQANNERLACYDAIYKPLPEVTTAQNEEVEGTIADNVTTSLPENSSLEQTTATDERMPWDFLSFESFFRHGKDFNSTNSLLDRRWELAQTSKLGTWQMRAYQPMYILPGIWTSDKNQLPSSPNPVNTVTTPQEIHSTEAKFQLSFKTKALENVFTDNGDLWIGYTQSSRWQVYNPKNSRPFRETNYEPEGSLIFRTNYNILGLNARLLGLTLNHQSNGRADPFSRSWNRLIFNMGLERNNFALMLRPWYRFDEDAKDDNNPDIKDYVGRGDLTAFYKWRDHNFSLMLRHSLKGGDKSRGAVQFDWAFPLTGALQGHLQIFDGYGESLIDYNHRATYVGLGVSLMNWY